jgi:hypothetical protein
MTNHRPWTIRGALLGAVLLMLTFYAACGGVEEPIDTAELSTTEDAVIGPIIIPIRLECDSTFSDGACFGKKPGDACVPFPGANGTCGNNACWLVGQDPNGWFIYECDCPCFANPAPNPDPVGGE